MILTFSVISTHTPLAGRDPYSGLGHVAVVISTHTPLAGRDVLNARVCRKDAISTHTPLAGRDKMFGLNVQCDINFYSHAPRGARLQQIKRQT